MSLIQEALKRQQEESKGKDGAGKASNMPPEPAAATQSPPPAAGSQLSASHAVSLKLKGQKGSDESPSPNGAETNVPSGAQGEAPPPIPVDTQPANEDTEEAVSRGRKGLKLPKGKMLLIGGIAAGVLIVGALAWVGMVAVKALSGSDAATPAASETAKPSAEKPADASKPATTADVKKPVTAAPADAGKTTPQQPVAKTETSNATAAGKTSTGIQKPPTVVQAPPPKNEVIQWPILVLNGLLRGAGSGSGGAIFNSKDIVAVGQEIQGVKLVSINANSTVTLSYKGLTRTLKIGDMTN